MEKDNKESIREYARRWSEVAAQVNPLMLEKEMVQSGKFALTNPNPLGFLVQVGLLIQLLFAPLSFNDSS
jgi:hypothetical protein